MVGPLWQMACLAQEQQERKGYSPLKRNPHLEISIHAVQKAETAHSVLTARIFIDSLVGDAPPGSKAFN